MVRLILLLTFLLSISGCASPGSSFGGEKSTQDRFGNALISPLSDLNIVRVTIPPIIQEALKNPYQMPPDTSCSALTEQVQKLDAVLGMDLDAQVLRREKTVAEQGQEFIENEAIGSVERTINGVIPFRGWVRKLTGAERHSREINAAIAAGVVRRAFLKGMGQEHGCQPPAAPVRRPPSVVFISTSESAVVIPEEAPSPEVAPLSEAAPQSEVAPSEAAPSSGVTPPSEAVPEEPKPPSLP